MGILENYHALLQDFPSSVTLVIAVKYADKEQIQELLTAGCHDFGFNTLQQLEDVCRTLPKVVNEVKEVRKMEEIVEVGDLGGVRIHFIGHLQSNKIRKLLDFEPYLIQSVDSFPLAEKIAQICKEKNIIQNILLQVKTDPAKEHGFLPEEVLKMAVTLHRSPRLRVLGLMTIPAPENPLPAFQLMKKLFDDLQSQLGRAKKMPHLSMGMSDDYPLAIQEGATMIRVGRKLFA
ncbi:YggS family pyridoxal phosphate-dependent enzyme [Candidatus Woesearchaeota archaeon]|nr:YggS family pyridoxal phosphate-dependent enzyme [Candidatus Woesearchaeota archaeon]